MSEEKKYTERDLVMAKREGWVTRALYSGVGDIEKLQQRAAQEFPLPRVTRPRVVNGTGEWAAFKFRVKGSVLEWACLGLQDWTVRPLSDETMFAQLGPLYADLLANPTEEGEGEG